MERYKVIKEVGDGTFGIVCQAINKQTGQVEGGLEPNGISKALKYGGVAIKKMKRKYYSWEECLSLREVKSLRRLNHPNIIKLKEVIRENDVLYLVFEYMEFNLYQLMKERGKPFTEVEIRTWCFQIFRALAYMHQHGYFHRDLKPENLLVTKNVLKIADFGLAREISSKPPFTEYVATRWYRAPEILLQSSVYDSAVDMWAMGAIMAELFTFRPLFPGSSEVDELHKICSVIGPPNRNSWAEGLHLADAKKFQFPKVASVPSLSLLIPSASKDAINLISSLCSWDSTKRPTAAKVLQHPFFQPCFHVPASPRLRLSGVPETAPSDGMKGALESKTARRHSFGFTSNTRLSTNFSSSSVNEPLKPGLQRKMETSSKENENERSFTNDVKPPRHQTTAMSMPGFLGRDSQRVSMAAEKLSQFSLNSRRDSETVGKARHLNPHLARQQPPVLKAGSWYRHNDLLGRPQEIPSSQTCYARKVAG